jgi:Tfp pilus assembly protein PilV
MSLIEVLVSLVVAALFLSILLPGASTALQRLRFSALQAEAVQLAHNQIEVLSVWPATAPAPPQGRVNGLQWKVEQIAVERPSHDVASAIVLRTFRVTVAAADDAAPLIELTVKRLGRAP